MAKSDRAKGWYPDPDGRDRFRYWDGRDWSGFRQGSMGHVHLSGWRALWYLRVARWPVVFYPLAWLDCSVPVTRGRLDRLMRPPQVRFSRSPSA